MAERILSRSETEKYTLAREVYVFLFHALKYVVQHHIFQLLFRQHLSAEIEPLKIQQRSCQFIHALRGKH